MNLAKNLTIAEQIAREAGELLRRGYDHEKQISRKSSRVDWVTQYDMAADALILDRLQAAFPGHEIITEESGHNQANSPYTWYVDPLDGTSNFAHGFPIFSVSLALYLEGKALLGVVYDPLRDECFSAVHDMGATVRRQGQERRLQVSQTPLLADALLGTGFPWDRHHNHHDNIAQLSLFLKRGHGVRRTGSAALDLAYVAAGRLDGFWEFKLHSWDIAAAILFIEEAGGQVTDLAGSALNLAPTVAIVASNGRIHPQMLATLHDVSLAQDPAAETGA